LFNGSTVVANATLAVSTGTTVSLNNVISIAPGSDLVLTMKLDTPFVNTALNPQSGNRVFQISNVWTAQQFANGSLSSYAPVAAGYITAAGLPVTASNY